MSSAEAFHFTCDHGARGIAADGVIRPNRHPMLFEPLAWFTDLWTPMRLVLGLTSYSLNCDRTRYRFDVARITDLEHWPRYCRRVRLPREVREAVESAPGTMPAHWWVSVAPVEPMCTTPVLTRAGSS